MDSCARTVRGLTVQYHTAAHGRVTLHDSSTCCTAAATTAAKLRLLLLPVAAAALRGVMANGARVKGAGAACCWCAGDQAGWMPARSTATKPRRNQAGAMAAGAARNQAPRARCAMRALGAFGG